jgi:hypothetical protein
MKKISIALFSLMSVLAFADGKQVTIVGQPALELFDRIERTGVERNTWTDSAGVKFYSIDVRKMVCDFNTHYDPMPAMCTILPGFMQKPVVSEGLKARNIVKAMDAVVAAGSAHDVEFGDCAMGKCSDETSFVSCYIDSSHTDEAYCTVESGINY